MKGSGRVCYGAVVGCIHDDMERSEGFFFLRLYHHDLMNKFLGGKCGIE